jgi:hypothetical protein
MQVTRFALLMLAAIINIPALAQNELQQAADALCEKVRSCAMAQVRQEDMTPEMRAMMEPMLENMCTRMRAGVADAPVDHKLYEPAVACMRSMADLSCEQIESLADGTPECRRYQEIVDSLDGD